MGDQESREKDAFEDKAAEARNLMEEPIREEAEDIWQNMGNELQFEWVRDEHIELARLRFIESYVESTL
jgi:hypothetical protein